MSDNITLEYLQKLHAELAEGQREVQEAQKKTEAAQQQETEAAIKELVAEGKKTEAAQQETEAEFKAIFREIAQRDKRADKRFNKLENLFTTQWGKLVESLVDGDLVKMLRGKGIDVEITTQNIKRERDGEHWEVDILALNGEDVVVVEVKTMMRVKDVKRFMERTLQNFKGVFPVYGDKRVLGAVAYLRSEESAGAYAEKKGLFVIRATGNSASIVNGEGFEPRAF